MIRQTFIWLKKESIEAYRTKKLIIILLVFAILGIMNPLLAKLMPEIMKTAMPANMQINLPEPTALDAWTQFFKNLTQMGLIVFILSFGDVMSKEIGSSKLIPLVTKGLKRGSVLIGKYLFLIILWTVAISLNFLISWGYTVYFFSTELVKNLFPSVLAIWLFGILLISILLLSSTMFSKWNSLFVLLLSLGVMLILNFWPAFKSGNPLSLASHNMAILTGKVDLSDFYWSIVWCLMISLISVILAGWTFRKKNLGRN
ncbi:ABC transporter permease [Enterococcus sp. ALS3]|uniref:ABC transporter permease n=1 Tax=Enterococcus alishanensis TaxID=1303817 RepID=A0ABS6TCW5_9ENTE|nr:ABC transporter permease [Enterococcus alishanensis]MBV7390769.1 ABC transporter permease [Enterococcus alishanensis]